MVPVDRLGQWDSYFRLLGNIGLYKRLFEKRLYPSQPSGRLARTRGTGS